MSLTSFWSNMPDITEHYLSKKNNFFQSIPPTPITYDTERGSDKRTFPVISHMGQTNCVGLNVNYFTVEKALLVLCAFSLICRSSDTVMC